jgi:hypothetical protein
LVSLIVAFIRVRSALALSFQEALEQGRSC